MIRRKISTGILRATKSTGNLRTSAGVIPPLPGQQNASLASATLLNSQRNWQKETVVTLKSELRARGLSQAGVKSALITRLESAESSTFLPPTTSLPSVPSRNASTTTTLPEAPKTASTGTDPKAKSVEPIADDHVTSTGPEILSQRSEATKAEPIKAESITVAPGLPETKDAMKSKKKDTLDIKMPGPPREAEEEQIIPFTPDNFKSNKSLTTESEKVPDAFMPKVMTVASASTHIAGGPQSAVHESTDATTHETKEVVEKIKSEIPGLLQAVSGVLTAPVRGIKSLGMNIEIGAPKGKPSGEYKASGEKLTSEERRGAWVLGGIVGLGLLLGGGRKSKKAGELGHGEKEGPGGKSGSREKGGKGGKSSALGDAEWEKASGAGVVGHGARKD